MQTNPNTAAAAWVAGLSAKTSKISAGIDAVTVAPGQAAARQVAAYVAGVNANQAKFQRNVSRVSLSDWQNATKTKGLPRIATGAQAAEGKMEQFFAKFLPFVQTAVQSLPPRGTYDQNKARAVAMMDKLHTFQL